MPLLTPDPTFYPSPTMATLTPPEKLAYVALINPQPGGADPIGVVDVDSDSNGYGRLVATTLMTLGVYRLWRHRHPRFGGMQVNFRDLTIWSFLMASAHGAGFMVIPFVMRMPAALSAASHEHAMHLTSGGTDVAAGALAVGVHTLAYLTVMALAAWLVYRRLGLDLLRTAWFNLDWAWAGALLITGMVVLFR